MSAKTLFGFHAVAVRLKTAPASVIEVHVDASRRDQRMRQLVERAQQAPVKLIDSDDARLTPLCGSPRHQGVVARVTPLPAAKHIVLCLDDLVETRRRGIEYSMDSDRPGMLIRKQPMELPARHGEAQVHRGRIAV